MWLKKKKPKKNNRNDTHPFIPPEIKNKIVGVLILILVLIISLSFFEKAGIAGKIILSILTLLFGEFVFFLPLILFLTSFVFLFTKYKNFLKPLVLAITLLVIGLSVFFGSLDSVLKRGGWFGYFISIPFSEIFGLWVSKIIFGVAILIGVAIFWYLLLPSLSIPILKEGTQKMEEEKKPSLIKRFFGPKFEVKELEPELKKITPPVPPPEFEAKKITLKPVLPKYESPPFDLLEAEKGSPLAGDVRTNAAIIKKTLENFGIPVEMSEINIGPTVTQYTLKPAEGVKLSKITALSNDLALSLAAHPIRIEAPIPGKSLVGIEVPNKVRTKVRLRELISDNAFQDSPSNLAFVLGRDVSGNPVYSDLARMPHLLVAGSTGTGKTIFLNNFILSLIYRNSPEILRFVLIDPKRVEFPIYNDLPHLLASVIYDAQRSVNCLKWLIQEMERRFDILAEEGARDISGYNGIVLERKEEPLPYIIVIVDELADLMASRGKEMEAGIVRLAQMARAVGIHLVVATQRPSVEVITGLIKANITSRISFQVASQVDSRTVLDMAGAEKLLGSGDLLFLSAEITKPKRIQGAYVSEKEVRKVIGWLQSKIEQKERISEEELNGISETSPFPVSEGAAYFGEDSLYEEAKRTVIEARKASASLLQRRLRIGYARAARLIDILEERGIVGPANGAKPRQVFIEENQET